jgi:hypothetical protein
MSGAPAVRGVHVVPGLPARRPEGTRAIWGVFWPADAPAAFTEDKRYLTDAQLAEYLAANRAGGQEWGVSWTVYDLDAGTTRIDGYDAGEAGRS